jgi:hypothetical protein
MKKLATLKMETIKKTSEIDCKNIKFSKMREERGHKFVSVFYNNHKFRVHSAKVKVPFGIKKFGDKYTMQLSVSDNNMKELLKDIDTALVKAGRENTKEWFQTNKDVGDFKSNVKQNGTYPPLVSVKLPQDQNGEFKFSLYNDKKEKVEVNEGNVVELFSKGVLIKPILECVGVWFKDNTYGISWKLFQAKKVEDKSNVCFVDDSDIDSEIEFIE